MAALIVMLIMVLLFVLLLICLILLICWFCRKDRYQIIVEHHALIEFFRRRKKYVTRTDTVSKKVPDEPELVIMNNIYEISKNEINDSIVNTK